MVSTSDLSMLRDHLIEVYQRVGVGLLKRQQTYDDKLQKQEQEWRATCDKLIQDHHSIKQQSKSKKYIFNFTLIEER